MESKSNCVYRGIYLAEYLIEDEQKKLQDLMKREASKSPSNLFEFSMEHNKSRLMEKVNNLEININDFEKSKWLIDSWIIRLKREVRKFDANEMFKTLQEIHNQLNETNLKILASIDNAELVLQKHIIDKIKEIKDEIETEIEETRRKRDAVINEYLLVTSKEQL